MILFHSFHFKGFPNIWGEWPSGLRRRCSKNQKVPGTNPIRRWVGLRDPTSLRGPRDPLVENVIRSD